MRISICVVLAALAVTGCHRPRRTANYMFIIGGEAAPVTAEVEPEPVADVVGGAHVSLQGADTLEDWVTVRGRFDLGIGGGPGLAGHLLLDAQLGYAFFDGLDHLFVRGGILGALEGDPVTGLYLLEVPTIFFGYQHHGRDADDAWHLDVGPRLSLGVLGSALAPGTSVDFVAAPATGGAVLVMGPFVTFELTYMHYFADASLDLVRGSACFGALFAVCLDTRHVLAPFGGQPGVTGYWGIRFGVGLAGGTDIVM